jgi:hypothetical protein
VPVNALFCPNEGFGVSAVHDTSTLTESHRL